MSREELLEGYRKVLRHVYSFDSIYRKLQHYWDIDFWGPMNEEDPIGFKYRLAFAARLSTMLFSTDLGRAGFILKVLPKVFGGRTRISALLTLMAHNDFAYHY
jgi:hypothetical protein